MSDESEQYHLTYGDNEKKLLCVCECGNVRPW